MGELVQNKICCKVSGHCSGSAAQKDLKPLRSLTRDDSFDMRLSRAPGEGMYTEQPSFYDLKEKCNILIDHLSSKNVKYLDFGLLIQHRKQFEDVTFSSEHSSHAFFTIFSYS